MTTPAILERLEGVQGRDGGPWMAKCPAHRDRTPSLSVAVTESGATLLHCHAGCEPDDVLAAVGLRFSDLYPPRESSQARPTPVGRNARISLQTVAHASLVAATLLGNISQSGRCTEAQADLAARLARDIQKALDAAGIAPAALRERKRA